MFILGKKGKDIEAGMAAYFAMLDELFTRPLEKRPETPPETAPATPVRVSASRPRKSARSRPRHDVTLMPETGVTKSHARMTSGQHRCDGFGGPCHNLVGPKAHLCDKCRQRKCRDNRKNKAAASQ